MTAVLPALAAAVLPAPGGVLVGRRHGRVLHVAAPGPRGLTPGGRLRRSVRPVCGQSAPAWPTATTDGRPLCARCQRSLAPQLGADPQRLAGLLPAGTLEQALATAPDDRTLHLVTLAVLALPGAQMARMTPLVRAARQRLAAGTAQLTAADRLGWQPRTQPAARFPRRVR